MQCIWLNLKLFQRPGVGQDSILGQSYSFACNKIKQKWIDKDEKTVKHLFSDVVNMKGGEYFFLPSMHTLNNIDFKQSIISKIYYNIKSLIILPFNIIITILCISLFLPILIILRIFGGTNKKKE